MLNSANEADKKVTVSFTAATGTDVENQVFYIPLPVGRYTFLVVSVSNGSDTKELKNWTDLEVVRGNMYYTTATVDASTVAAVNEALTNVGDVAATVNLTGNITTDEPVIILDAAKDVT